MKLIIQPENGTAPILNAIKHAQKSIDVLIFRLDLQEIAEALQAAVLRGIRVRALTAHQNHGGTKRLRELEMQLLEGGVTVSRTAKDLVRYHGKMMIVDSRLVHIYGFNFTWIDIKKSRSLGIETGNTKLVAEAMKLFAADFDRQPYQPSCDRFVVSPQNCRDRLAALLKGARRQLLIYDPHMNDDDMLKIITAKIGAGVDVRIIGKVDEKWKIRAEKYPGKRLHVRCIIRDGRRAFIGSQSLRRLELDERREVGVIVTHPSVVRELVKVFERDWAETPTGRKAIKKELRALAAAS